MRIRVPSAVVLWRQCLQRPIGSALILVYLLGFYTHITLYVRDDLKVPVVLCGVAAVLMCIRNIERIRASHLKWLGTILLLGACSILLRSDAAAFLSSRASGLLYFGYSLFCAYSCFLELNRWQVQNAKALFVVLLQLLLFGSILERAGVLLEPSNRFRAAVYEESTIYDNETRDNELFGGVRPMLFTSEPSHLAKAYLIALVAMLVLSKNRMRYAVFFGLAAVGLFVIRSPVILLAVPLGGLTFIYIEAGGVRGALRRLRLNRGLQLAAVVLGGVVLIAGSGMSVFAVRWDKIKEGRDDSFTMRVVGPAAIASRVVRTHPIWGAGISGKEAIEPAMVDVYAAVGLSHPERLNTIGVDSSVNSFWMHWTYFGFVGGILAAWAIFQWISSLNKSKAHFVFWSLCLLANAMGAYNGVRLWTMAAILAACASLIEEPGPVPEVENETEWASPDALVARDAEAIPS